MLAAAGEAGRVPAEVALVEGVGGEAGGELEADPVDADEHGAALVVGEGAAEAVAVAVEGGFEGRDVEQRVDALLAVRVAPGAEGVAQLETKALGMKYGSYKDIPSEDERVAILKEIETTPFFQKIRGSLITGIYNNQELWPFFGYEGASADKGGYINRGFNDIDWL